MKLLGRDIRGSELIELIEDRLRARGLLPEPEDAPLPGEAGADVPVDPLSFNLGALEEYADPTRPLPLPRPRDVVEQVGVLARWALRRALQPLRVEVLGRQRAFNGHVRDSYAQLAAEVLKLRRELDALQAAASKPPVTPKRRPATPRRRR